jgi:hypothetical protein
MRICNLCAQAITPGQTSSRCSEEIYSAQEMELMGLDDYAYTCDTPSHTACIEALSAPRQCCAPIQYPEGLCVQHARLGPGFFCLDCGLWHQPHCFARSGYRTPSMPVPQGRCIRCEHEIRLHLAIQDISDVPVDTLEALGEAWRSADVADNEHLVKILGLVRDLGSVRVPYALKDSVSAEVAVRALQRLVVTARQLQSGLEREFFEMLSRGGIEPEFRAQRSIPLDVASREGSGRRSTVVTPDFTHRALPYVVFLDGGKWHSTEDALADDAEITTELSRRGFLVRRFRYRHLSPEFQAQTLATVECDLAQLRSEALQKGFV